ncbi:hypothetical protein EV647_2311 [Kribbella sp. VKM Ac-2566]|nr:hypothetical protein EV647_2311 [Kribbella sp. VKM Ac-2566]
MRALLASMRACFAGFVIFGCGRGLGCCAEGKQVEPCPGQITVFDVPGAVQMTGQTGRVTPVTELQSRNHSQHEYYQDDVSDHGSNYSIY